MAKDIVQWANDSMGDTEPITITLEGEGNTSVDFETAFGDFSELRGRGRRRQQKRRMERIARRQERRALRRAGRRQAMQERQEMKSERKAQRVARRRMGEEEEMPSEAPSEMPMEDTGDGSSYDPMAEIPESPISEPIREENQLIDESVDSEVGQSDYDSGYTGDYGFDGERMMSEMDGEYDNYYASAEGQAAINPAVADISRRIEKNKEMISRMQGHLDRVNARVGSGQPNPRQAQRIAQLTSRIAERKQRLAMLEQKLGGYSSMDADILDSIGDYQNADGTNPRLEARLEKTRKRAEVRAAKRAARVERKKFIKSSLKSKRQARMEELFAELSKTMPAQEAMREARKRAINEVTWKGTAVEADLNATISPNRIEVPAESSSFSGTGLIGLDNVNDYDAPSTRNLELNFSNASGTRKVDWKNIAIGVGVAFVGIYVYQRFIKK